jgi:hypothetical protein
MGEPALKGFAFEARRLAKDDFDNAVWLGVAEPRIVVEKFWLAIVQGLVSSTP